jgi:hypothetical protein
MRACILLAVILQSSLALAQVGTPVPAGVRTGDASGATARGIDALVRGDYTTAAELLRPLVDAWAGTVDEAAAFFLATLYENGLGVPQDLPRACALYSRIEGGSGPFARLAGPLAREQMEKLGPGRQDECVLLLNMGINHGFSPARFVLGPDRTVTIDLSSKSRGVEATVSQRGEEKTSPLQAPQGTGAIFLPIEHSALEWPRGSGELRHFVEIAAWVPLPDTRWQLAWSLSEIAGTDVISVAEGALTTTSGRTPPLDVSVPLRDLVSLGVTEDGAVEFAILDAAEGRRERVPDAAERREIEQELRKRRAADEKVNWKRRRDPARAPSYAFTDARACGLVWLSGWSAERTESIAIRADRRVLQEQAASQDTFDLAALPPGIDVVVTVFDRPQRDWSVCSDVESIEQGERRETWRAVSGILHIRLPQANTNGASHYRASIRIDNAEFSGPGGASSRPLQPITLSAVATPGPAQ